MTCFHLNNVKVISISKDKILASLSQQQKTRKKYRIGHIRQSIGKYVAVFVVPIEGDCFVRHAPCIISI